MTKTKSYIIGLLLAVGLFATFNHAPAQGKQSQAGCIIIGYTSTLGPVITHEYGSYRPQTGLQVTWIERGPGADGIPIAVGEPLGQVIEKIMANSFRKEHYEFLPQGYGWMIFIRQ